MHRLAAHGGARRFSFRLLLISGSKVRALVRPPSKPFAPPSIDGAAALLRRFDLTLLSLRATAQKETRRREVVAGAFNRTGKAQ
jgi:hypothetical protein